MATEKPKADSPENVIPQQSEAPAVEQSEGDLQNAQEQASRERFIQEWVTTSSLSPEQKVKVIEYVTTRPGPWREYNGGDFRVVDAHVEGDVWKVSFGVFMDDYEAQRIDVEIPF